MTTYTEKVTAAIPTIGRVEILPTLITSLAFQTRHIDELLILDEAKTPIMESYAVNQAMDLMSLQGTDVRLIRSRNRQGIASARLRLAEEAAHEYVLMVDDDVVPRPRCAELLYSALQANRDFAHWAVPTCLLLNAALELDGYRDTLVDASDPEVQAWTNRYPWFVPYFRYRTPMVVPLSVAGTQTILLRKTRFLGTCADMYELGNLPREDTYMTAKMGTGLFVSEAECLHFEHHGQIDRGNWGRSMFYRLHEAILRDPDAFLSLMRKP